MTFRHALICVPANQKLIAVVWGYKLYEYFFPDFVTATPSSADNFAAYASRQIQKIF
ncbi:hypothetical protein GGU45_003551 [Niabella hirudinis]